MPKLFFSSKEDLRMSGYSDLVFAHWQNGGISPAAFNQEVGRAFLPAATALVNAFALAGMRVDATVVWNVESYDNVGDIRVFTIHLGVRVVGNGGNGWSFKGFVMDTPLDSDCFKGGRLRNELSSFLTDANRRLEGMFLGEEERLRPRVDDFVAQVRKYGYLGSDRDGMTGRHAGYAVFELPVH